MADNAKRDNNRIPTLLGVDSIGFTEPTTVAVDATTHAMLVSASFSPSGTQDVNLTKVGGAVFALGQQLAAASLPVVLTAAQISTLTPLSTVAVTQSTSPWIVAGGGTAGSAATGVVTIQGIASMTAVQVGDNAASLSVDWNGTQPVTGSGNATGALRVELPTNGTGVIATVGAVTAITNALPAGNNNIGDVDIASGTVTTVTTVTNVGAGNAAATIAADGVTPTVPGIAAYGFVKTPGANTWDRHAAVVNATNSTGTGIASAGILAQFDDAAPTSITENQFGNLRMSANRNLYGTIRDAAGNERGLNIDSNNRAGVVATNSVSESFSAAAALTITLASLANSTVGVGRQSTLVDNTTNLFAGANIYCRITTGTTPTANSYIYVYLIRRDNSANADDNAGTTDAGLTIINSTLLGSILVPAATSNTGYYKVFDTTTVCSSLGPQWGIAVVNSSGVALNATGGNHVINWVGFKKQLN